MPVTDASTSRSKVDVSVFTGEPMRKHRGVESLTVAEDESTDDTDIN